MSVRRDPQIPGYRIESILGRGGMGVVYLAEDINLGRKVALKVLAPELANDPSFRARFLRESRMAAAIDHPNIVPIYEARDVDGQPFVAMRHVDGPDLAAVLHREGPLALERVLSIASQLGEALDAAHARGLVHRDVKPGNVLLAPTGHRAHPEHVYLGDFGLTKRFAAAEEMTRTGQLMGTVDYMAPEQIQGEQVGAATDQYSLACLVYQCLTGRAPFAGEADTAVLWAHIQRPPPRATDVRPDLPPGVDAVIAKGMAKLPGDRYATCSDLADSLRSAADGGRSYPTGPGAATIPGGPGGVGRDRDADRDARVAGLREPAARRGPPRRDPAATADRGIAPAPANAPARPLRRQRSPVTVAVAAAIVGVLVVAVALSVVPLLSSGRPSPSRTAGARGDVATSPGRTPARATRTPAGSAPTSRPTRTPPVRPTPPFRPTPPRPTATVPSTAGPPVRAADIQRLRMHIPAAIRGQCAPTSDDLVARRAVARLVCRFPPSAVVDSISYSLHARPEDMNAAHRDQLAANNVPTDAGSCTEDTRAEGPYERGRFACYQRLGATGSRFENELFANVRFTDDALNISIGVLGNSSDVAAVYAWAVENALPER